MFRKAAAPVVSEHARLRAKQLTEFLKLNPSAVSQPHSAADSAVSYSLGIHTSTCGMLQLTIMLGPLFPERPPLCQLTAPGALAGSSPLQATRLSHKYLDANGFLSQYPKLQPTQWSPHQNLGLLIQDLARELTISPPTLVQPGLPAFAQQQPPQPQPQYGASANSAAASYGSGSSYMSDVPKSSPAYSSQPSPSTPATPPLIPPRRPSLNAGQQPAQPSPQQRAPSRPPPIPATFPELDAMSIQQLEDLLSDPSAVRDLAAQLDIVTQHTQLQRELMERVAAQAKQNLSRKEAIEQQEREFATQAAQYQEAHATYQALLQRQQAVQSRFQLSTLLAQLDTALDAADESSERVRERYAALQQKAPPAGQGEDQGLLEAYIKERMLWHQRAAKKERAIECFGAGRQ